MNDTFKKAAEIAKTDPARAYDLIEAHEAGRNKTADATAGKRLFVMCPNCRKQVYTDTGDLDREGGKYYATCPECEMVFPVKLRP